MHSYYTYPDAASQLRIVESSVRAQINLTSSIEFRFPSILKRATLALENRELLLVQSSADNTPILIRGLDG